MKRLALLVCMTIFLSGCWDLKIHDPILIDRGEKLCTKHSGVYRWGSFGNHGRVMCYDNKVMYDLFTKERIWSNK